MKKLTRLFVIALAVVGLSCEKTKNDINEATEFNIDYSSQVKIPEAEIDVAVPADFSTPDIPTQSENRFAAEKTAKDLIDEIVLTRFNISTTNGNLDFLKEIKIFIQATGLNEVHVASKTNIPAGSTSVATDLSGANIKEFISKDKIKFRVSVTISSGLSEDQTLKIDQTVRVKGKKIK